MKVVIVVPAWNEGEVLRKSVPFLINSLEKLISDFSWNVIIVDNNSQDNTLSVAEDLANSNSIAVRSSFVSGRGAVLRDTWLNVNADIYAYIDADLDIHPDALVQGIENVALGWDVVVGSKRLIDSKIERSLWRNFVSSALHYLVKYRYNLGISDTQCGMKVLSRSAVDSLLPLTRKNDWLFDLELLIQVKRLNLKVLEIPVEVKANRIVYRKSKVKVFSTAVNFLKFFLHV